MYQFLAVLLEIEVATNDPPPCHFAANKSDRFVASSLYLGLMQNPYHSTAPFYCSALLLRSIVPPDIIRWVGLGWVGLVGWLVGGLVGWLIAWLVVCLLACLLLCLVWMVG